MTDPKMSSPGASASPEAQPPCVSFDGPCEWKVVTSRKPLRKGEFFLLRNETFVIKVYRDVTPPGFADWLCRQLELAERRKARHEMLSSIELLKTVTPVDVLRRLRRLLDGSEMEHLWLNSPEEPSYGPLDLIDAALLNADKPCQTMTEFRAELDRKLIEDGHTKTGESGSVP